LQQAKKLTPNSSRLRRQLLVALTNLQRFAEHPGWHSVRGLLNGKSSIKDAFELSLDLLEKRQLSGEPPHPIHWLTAATAAQAWWHELDVNGTFDNNAYLEALLRQVEDLYRHAEKACGEQKYASEADHNRLRFLTTWTLFLLKHKQSLQRYKLTYPAIDSLVEDALRLLCSGVDGTHVPGEWYELIGDSFEDHKAADEVYQFGTQWAPSWKQLWIKYLGCACILYPDPRFSGPQVAEVRAQVLSPAEVERILDQALQKHEQNAKTAQSWVIERWLSGVNLFARLYPNDMRIQHLIQQYTSTNMKHLANRHRSHSLSHN